MFLLAVRD